jgi:ribosomal-protein-serine acetyltransferase
VTPPPERIDVGAVTLRRWRPADLEASCDAVLASQEHLKPWMPWAVDFSRAGQEEFLALAQRQWDAGEAFLYAMIVAGQIAGSIGLHGRIAPDGLEIGYWVHADFTRRGLATVASAALADVAFAMPGIERVEIVVDELNFASAGVPRKLGFTDAGRRKLTPPPLGGSGHAVVWQLTRDQWPGAAAR